MPNILRTVVQLQVAIGILQSGKHLFKELRKEMNSKHCALPFHSAVQCCQKGNFLNGFMTWTMKLFCNIEKVEICANLTIMKKQVVVSHDL